MDTRYDEHYVRSVVKLGDTRNVFTNQAIFTSKNIKLVEKGIKVDSTLYDRLVSHKLIPKIDQCLSVEDGVTHKNLLDYASNLLDNDPGMAVFRRHPKIRDLALDILNGIPLLEPLAFKLTVAKEQRPDVFDHSVRVALISLLLARKSFFLTKKELTSLMAAALFHDLGVLHIQPDLMTPGRQLHQSERHHLYTHPITGFLILRNFPEYHPEISRAVFEHHERLDGSGYPRGLKSESICLGAQILMLAEVANTVFVRNAESQSLAKLSVMLKLNRTKFNPELCNQLLAILNEVDTEKNAIDEEVSAFVTTSAMETRLSGIAKVFLDWNETSQLLLDGSKLKESGSVLKIIEERVADLQRSLLYTGFDVSHATTFVDLIRGDPEAMGEFSILVNETRWQLAEIVNEAHRRMGEMAESDPGERALVIGWLEKTGKTLQLH